MVLRRTSDISVVLNIGDLLYKDINTFVAAITAVHCSIILEKKWSLADVHGGEGTEKWYNKSIIPERFVIASKNNR